MDTQRNRPAEDITEWLRFFLSCLSHIQENLMLKLDQRKTENETTSQRERSILFLIENRPGCGSGEISSRLNIPLPTVKKTLAELVEKKLLNREGIGRATAYFLI
jgi:DNA-binding MarR family transcriptional regulator